jgi:hypothetical protein
MTRFAIITATPPSVNPGMLVCEATARSFISRAGLSTETTFFRVQSLKHRVRHADPATLAPIIRDCDLGIDFELLDDVRQLDQCVPVFWGDFLHMKLYINRVSHLLGCSESSLRKLLLLEDTPSDFQRSTITAFTSILFNSTADYCDPEYGPSFRRFFQQAYSVQMRDAISAAVVSPLRQGEQTFGIDAAQLLASDECASDVLGTLFDIQRRSERALLFFARGRHDLSTLNPFVFSLLSELNVQGRWIPWGDKISFPFGGDGWVPTVELLEQAPSHLHRLLDAIRRSTVVITDTYHLSVVSWALGVPAVMIAGDYHAPEIGPKSLDLRPRHDKRKVLYAQDGLLDFYVEPYLIASGGRAPDIVRRLTRAIQNQDMARDVRHLLSVRAVQAEAKLLKAIRTVRRPSSPSLSSAVFSS